MPEQSIRFTVSDGASLRSSTWKCWTPSGKEDIYLACREMNGAMKVSFHQSGACHFAYDPSFFSTAIRPEDRTDKGRFIDQWSPPTPIFPGVLRPLRIVIPSSSVTTPYTASPDLIEVPKPPDDRPIEFAMLISEPTTTVKAELCLVGTYRLPSGRSVRIVRREALLPEFPSQTVNMRYFEGASLDDVVGDGLRMTVLVDASDGSKVIYDCKVRRDDVGTA